MIFSFEDDQYACNILKWLGPMPPYGQRVPTDLLDVQIFSENCNVMAPTEHNMNLKS